MTNKGNLADLAKSISKSQSHDFLRNLEAISSHQQEMLKYFQTVTSAIDISSTLANSLTQISKTYTQSSQVLEVLEHFTDPAELMRKNLTRLFGDVEEAVRLPLANIASTVIAFDSLSTSKAFETMRKRLELDEQTVEAYTASGWPIAPSMDQELRKRVRGLFVEGKARYSSNPIIGYYKKESHSHTKSAIEEWRNNRLYSRRMHIIEDALEAHYQGLFTLSVPALMPQVEGILIDYVKASDLDVGVRKIRDVYDAAIGDPLAYDVSRWLIASVLHYHLTNSTYAFTDFEEELSKSIGRRRVTRHTVLHGIATNYDRPKNSLRTILLLDALSILEVI